MVTSPCSIHSRLRRSRRVSSLRTQISSAVVVSMGVSSATLHRSGATALAGSRLKVITARPITAFQNPIVVQGSVKAKSASISSPIGSTSSTNSVSAISQRSAPEVDSTSAAKPARRHVMEGRTRSGATASRSAAGVSFDICIAC